MFTRMSIDYYAVPSLDEEVVRAFIDGRTDALSLQIPRERIATKIRFVSSRFVRFEPDFAKRAASLGITEAEARKRLTNIELNWRDEEDAGYVQVVVESYGVAIHTGAHGGDQHTAVMLGVFAALQDTGLHVWDAQASEWFPRSA